VNKIKQTKQVVLNVLNNSDVEQIIVHCNFCGKRIVDGNFCSDECEISHIGRTEDADQEQF
jgi:hypothetical protein